jgi:hypothetical protein
MAFRSGETVLTQRRGHDADQPVVLAEAIVLERVEDGLRPEP